jgi:hypothetical protein
MENLGILHTNGGSPRIRTEFSPVKSRDFTIKVCNPIKIPSALNSVSGHYFDRASRRPCASTCRQNEFNWGKWLARLKPWRKLVEHPGIAPSIPAWKAGVYLSTPMLGNKNWQPTVAELMAL